MTPGAPVRRLPLLAALLLAAIFAALAGNATRPGTGSATAVDPAARPPAGTLSAAWYCPGAVASLPLASESLRIANVGSDDAQLVARVYPDDGGTPVATTLEVPARSAAEFPRADLGPAGGVAVEAFTRDVVVESAVTDDERAAVEACPTRPSATWFFAAGTTVRGVEQYLALFNPLGSDAKVDVTLFTEAGTSEPDRLRSIDVPRRSRVVVPVHEVERRAQRVGVRVHATLGQVVAEQTLLYGGGTTTPGIARSTGAVAPTDRWLVPDVTVREGVGTFVAVVNPNEVDADVDVVAVAADPEALVDPLTVTVPAGRSTWVRIGTCPEPPDPNVPCVPIATEGPVAVDVVAAAPELPVVAEYVARFDGARGGGVLTSRAARAGARAWYFATTTIVGSSRTTLAFTTPGSSPVSVDVTVVREGEEQRPDGYSGIEVPPGPPVRVALEDALEPGTALVVRSSGEVVVQRTMSGDEITGSLGVPEVPGR